MKELLLTVSINPEDNDVDSLEIEQQVKDLLLSSSALLLNDSTNLFSIFKLFNEYSEGILPLALTLQSIFRVSIIPEPTISNKSTTIILDMDGNIITKNGEANFSDTKYNAKSILGSVEKISKNDILIADSKNKRAIIVDVLKNRIKWEYISDRYIYDAHLFPRDNDINNDDFIVSSSDFFLITEGDSFESPFTSKIRKIDMFGNTIWDFGDNVSKPRDARPLINNQVIISV